MVKRLEQQTEADFAALRTGTHTYTCEFPDGLLRNVEVHIWRTRAKTRLGEFDIVETDWAFHSESNPKGNSALLRVTVHRDVFGTEMRRCVEALPQLLIPYPKTL